MAVESSLRKDTETPYSVATRAPAREGNNPETSTPSRIPIPKTGVGLACSDNTPSLPQSSTKSAQAIPGGQDTTPASTKSQ
ncbi:unnamed protein product [Trichobilharzia regenti]|nr:unnamed protein product [Trichobilharzia regenti]